MQFKAFEDGIEVNGQTVFSIVDGMGNFKPVAIKHLLGVGITKGTNNDIGIDLNSWYSQDKWLEAFENIANNIGDSILFQIGQAIPRNAQFPPWVQDIDGAIKSIDIAYHMNHRKNGKPLFDPETMEMTEGIGHYGYESIENKNMIISECNNPYPCDFDRGIIDTMAKKFELKANVVHDDSKPCRKKGADSCTYLITW